MELTARINALRLAITMGGTTYEKAREIALPLLTELNLRLKAIASRLGKAPQKFQFAGFGRNLK